ncbi:hypothetical protein SESBI_11223 [Sesbania bispinosa]|nr:hypothetical protein SESBI_11223 [Sesbania bispinosa]
MEKQSNLKNKILKILPKVTVAFQNPPFSPGRDHKLRPHSGSNGEGFSGPVVSMIPDEARRKPKHGGTETQEPTSPKISCMGQIKHKKKQIKKSQTQSMSVSSAASTPEVKKKHIFSSSSMRLQRMFSKPKHLARFKSDDDDADAVGNSRAPPMGEMRRFASGREAFANFDWKAQIAPEEIEQRGCFSDAEEVEDEVIIPFSAPILGGAPRVPNAQPRQEINLWKRRTMAPPRPLQLKPVLTAK